jgi:phosphoglucomutase/phosphomannomutase
VAIATDPDCDRIGCAAPLTFAKGAEWHTLTGNQLCALLADYVLETRKKAGRVTLQHFIVKTLVTTQMVRRVGDSYGVRTIGDLLVGFKWIAQAIDQYGPDLFLFGTEESHGYMAGTYARDKDGAVAALLLCELAAKLKAEGKTVHEKLDDLFWQHGVHVERTVSVQMPGSEGMARMQEVMAAFRAAPPAEIGGDRVKQVRDYERQTVTPAGGKPQPLAGPKGDLVFLDLATEGNHVACRPSGTEPKIKFYMFGYIPAEQLSNLENAKSQLNSRLDQMEADLRKFAGV